MPPTCTISFRPDLGLLVVRWPADAAVPQLQADFAAVLEAALTHQTARWLLDVRRRAEQDPELARWAVEVFYPQAAAALAPQPLRLAALASPTRIGNYAHDDDTRQVLDYGLDGSRPYRLQLFGDEGAAVRWLQAH